MPNKTYEKAVQEMTVLLNDYQEHIEKEAIEALKSLYSQKIREILRSRKGKDGFDLTPEEIVQLKAIRHIDADKIKIKNVNETKFDKTLQHIINIVGVEEDDDVNLWKKARATNNNIKLLDDKRLMANKLVTAMDNENPELEPQDKLNNLTDFFNDVEFQSNPGLLEERRKPSKFWKIIDSFLKFLGGTRINHGCDWGEG